jgi:hypothetical protein
MRYSLRRDHLCADYYAKGETMWTKEHTIEATVSPGAIWRRWVDVSRWPDWNADIEQIELHGPFAAGGMIVMTPRGQQSVELRIAETRDGQLFVDEADLDGTLIRTTHRIERLDEERIRIVYRLDASGPLADQLGAAVSSDFPDTLAALVSHASADAA